MTYADRVKDTTTTAGTGTITLAQSVQAGIQLFGTAFSAASTITYCISSRTTSDWEITTTRSCASWRTRRRRMTNEKRQIARSIDRRDASVRS